MNIVLFLIAIILIFIFKINKPKIKGHIGESRIAGQLNKLDDKEYKVLNNIFIRTSKGSSQIDHIVISTYGIFVIETKNYSGWIHGNENSEYWTQTFYKSRDKFRNPIKQNWSHIYALKEVLSNFRHITYHPIIVFVGSGELKNVTSQVPVVYDNELFQIIARKSIRRNLSISEVKIISDQLSKLNILDKDTRKEHVQQIHKNNYERIQKERSLVCPRCGGNLLVRNGPYGKFYGCSNYPNCRYKKNIRG
ncbi:MAG: NERD domain-containing protein [Spirochaetia bacterium]|nr:NERD domain-containing protein [Spirochaetia bacterium]